MMADLHAINDAINKKAGRKLLPSILVSLFLLGLIFGTINTQPLLFFAFIWVVIMIGIREITAAYGKGGIELPDYVLMIAATVLLVATWNGNTQGLAVSAGLTIPILMFTLLLISQKDFIKRSTSAVFITFYLAVLGGFILLLANHQDALIGLMTVVTATCGDLIESAIKRDLAIKDMSNLLPGHGGIMDRLDSALFTAPAVWFAIELINRYL
ncbi:MAG: phosphatidate cytidylyltransferase [Actinobacteria bacterium]|nr:phosphatidate cytidylyltransferase [Actinomycetota bacterium]